MKSPLSDASKSVRVTSESIQRELSQLIVHLEGTTRGVDDARFRKIAMKSAEVLKGLRTLFERLGSEDQAAGAKRPETATRDAKAAVRPSAATGKESGKKADVKATAPTKTNGTAPLPAAGAKASASAAKPESKVATRPTKFATGVPAPEPAAPAKSDSITANLKPEDPAEIAAKAQLQKQEARAPKRPGGHAAPRPMPPQSGKPIWSKPHSS